MSSEKLADDLQRSRECEMQAYLNSMQAIYDSTLQQNSEIYEIAAQLTQNFAEITPDAILADSRIIKILRYAIAPSISQMKFGQFFGLKSLSDYENDKLQPGTAKYRQLADIAPDLAQFAITNLDLRRFLWLVDEISPQTLPLALHYAQQWTCSLAADQNAQTRYRNWRKNLQEHAIAATLIELGYTKSRFTGTVDRQTDINIGEYTQERKVRGRTVQKADLVVRSKRSKQLILIEAKAVGVEIDSTKRIKECCDKANDWRSAQSLGSSVVITVIAGFFTPTGIDNLHKSKIQIVWEHRLEDLADML
ncbi:MAG: XamI family restriction endonuclease, partial [Coleofasciculaceae cyanobacterium RL_1_1]|nr:XamI family restriction endonuclease [Coleofasciculaceae cyanobacterium RL_1_1]